MAERNYKVTVLESTKELTAVEKVQIKDTTECIQLGNQLVVAGDSIVIQPDYAVVLGVHNENAKDDKDYEQYIIVAKDGTRYSTGSISLWNAFCDINDDLEGEGIDYSIKIKALPSKNRKDKVFLTCSLV